MKISRSLSHTIESDDDWETLYQKIDREVTWSIDIANTIKTHIQGLHHAINPSAPRPQEPTTILIMQSNYGIFDFMYDGEQYVKIIIKSTDPDIMICDYPKHTINLTSPFKYNIIYYVGGITLCIFAGMYLYRKYQSK